MPHAIECRQLWKRYDGKPPVDAVRGLDLTVDEGECFGLLGPNGAGKTTTMEIIEGLLAATSGEVKVLGYRWGQHDDEICERIGISLQETRLSDKLTVRETVTLFRSFYASGITPDEAIARVSLQEKAHAWVEKLSGGQKQRLAVACALVGDPQLLFLDEPTTGLDPHSRRELWNVIGQYRSAGRTVMLTTHYMDEAERLCDRVAVVDRGQVIALGSPAQLIAHLGGENILDFQLTAAAPQPAAIFWVYGFPLIMITALGVAFRDDPVERIAIDLIHDSPDQPANFRDETAHSRQPVDQPPALITIREQLAANESFEITTNPAESWRKRLQAGKTDLVIEVLPGGDPPWRFWDEPRRAESRLARHAVEAALLRSQHSAAAPAVSHLDEPGSRYIDFLLPGMIGMSLMGGGLWGVGFVIVDMRVRKLLKRFLATPMRRSDFLLAIMLSRLAFSLVDIVFLLLLGYFAFGVRCSGSYLDLAAAVLMGGVTFGGIGLLVASRAQTLETASGLMNLVMLPMWIVSGVFFSSERFPADVQPIINALPLTALNQLLRGIMLEGVSIVRLWPQGAILAAYAVITFALALRVFRWR